ncbi:MAG: hypothetical protein K1X94_20085 [Sandaracinaceae bacterium]|nr:hypothetical protein [Sandaracinaceae bacterium]
MSRSTRSLEAAAWAAALSCGLGAAAGIGGSLPLAFGAAAAGLLGLAAFARETALSKRWPRARRPQWAARLLLIAAALIALPAPWVILVAGLVGGAGTGLLAREARRPFLEITACLAGGLTAGLALAQLTRSVALPLALGALVLSALAALASSFRGGPGRPPVRPVDVVWLYVLGAALAAAMALPR